MDGLLHIEAVEGLTGLEGAWIRVPDHGWTIATTNYLAAHLTYNSAQCVEWVHRWVRECYLPVLADAEETEEAGPKPAGPITDPQALTVEILENYTDSKLVGFLVTAIHQGAQTAFTLSPFAVRVSSNGTGKPQAEPGRQRKARKRR
jgi:hypothetical protein